ncbi:MAG: T9SS type A sorting domain-containing protein [Rhodothermales bacterium]
MPYRYPAALVAALFLFASAALAQKPEARSPLEVGADRAETLARANADRQVAPDGTPRALYRVDYAVRSAAPEAMAREYLAAHAADLRLKSADLSDLAVRHVRSGKAGHTVRFTQTLDGVPVWGSETVVNLDRQDRVQLVFHGYQPDLAVASTVPALAAADARQIALDHLDARGTLLDDEADLVIYPTEAGARLAWRVFVTPDEPFGNWESFVDAETGALLRVARRTVFHSEHGHGERETAPVRSLVEVPARPSRVDATGFIHDPDPLTRAGASYGDPGLVDGNDADTPELEAARMEVTLRDVTFDGTVYKLEGPYADILDWAGPFKGEFEQETAEWNFTRQDDAFEAATTYWHIDNYMRYINETLEIDVQPYQYSTGVRFDPHGFNGADNSSYGGGRLQFGEGGVDDAEDADVIIHELGHGLHDWLTVGGLSNGDGLSEGLGDYFAVSYERSLGLLDEDDAAYNWVFKWDGHNPFWNGRRTDFAGTYPSGSAPHARGQHWSTSLMRILETVGVEATDTAVIEGIAMTTGSTTQPQAAQAVLQAAVNMGYPNRQVVAMEFQFNEKGYNVEAPLPPVANEDGASADRGFELEAAYPNPFSAERAATLTLRVDAPQRVAVTLYDVLGRTVRVLHDGPLAADTPHTFTVEAGDLPSGLYVYRVAGEGFAETQTLTLVR